MFDIAHFIMVLYICIMCPQFTTKRYQPDWEKVLNTIVTAGFLLNIYIQITTAVIEKVRIHIKNILCIHQQSLEASEDLFRSFEMWNWNIYKKIMR